MKEISFNNQTLILSVLEQKPLFDAEGNTVDYTNHRTTLTPNDAELVTEMGDEVEKAFHFFMTDEVKAEFAKRTL